MLPWELKVILRALCHISQNLIPVRYITMGTKGGIQVIVALLQNLMPVRYITMGTKGLTQIIVSHLAEF